MSQETLKLFHVPNISALGAKCALTLIAGSASPSSAHLEALTIVAKADGSTHSHIEHAELDGPPFKDAAEAAILKAKGKALTLLSSDGSLPNKLTELGNLWEETTRATVKKEIRPVADEISGLLARVQSDALKDLLREAKDGLSRK